MLMPPRSRRPSTVACGGRAPRRRWAALEQPGRRVERATATPAARALEFLRGRISDRAVDEAHRPRTRRSTSAPNSRLVVLEDGHSMCVVAGARSLQHRGTRGAAHEAARLLSGRRPRALLHRDVAIEDVFGARRLSSPGPRPARRDSNTRAGHGPALAREHEAVDGLTDAHAARRAPPGEPRAAPAPRGDGLPPTGTAPELVDMRRQSRGCPKAVGEE
jgi:hypothetical protein